MKHENIEAAARWAAEEYERRTRCVEDGTLPRVDWLHEETRVSWSEVCSRFFDGCEDVVGVRLQFDKAFRRVTRKGLAAAKPLDFYPPLSGAGKWHVSKPVGNVAACGSGALLDKASGHRIQVVSGDRPHPICCKKCLLKSG